MIKGFAGRATEALYNGQRVRAFQSFQAVAERKLAMLDAATALMDLSVPPGNRLEALSGDHQGWYSIRINRQWRICFRWFDGHAYDVEIVDYQ